MFRPDQLRVIEFECGFHFPIAFWTLADELIAHLPAALPRGRIVTPSDLTEAWKLGLLPYLIPFACEPRGDEMDYY